MSSEHDEHLTVGRTTEARSCAPGATIAAGMRGMAMDILES
jgi:hypothetical protein